MYQALLTPLWVSLTLMEEGIEWQATGGGTGGRVRERDLWLVYKMNFKILKKE